VRKSKITKELDGADSGREGKTAQEIEYARFRGRIEKEGKPIARGWQGEIAQSPDFMGNYMAIK
jgi:hypothetical protein